MNKLKQGFHRRIQKFNPLYPGTYVRYHFIIQYFKKKNFHNILEIWSGLYGISYYYDIPFTGLDKTQKSLRHKRKKGMKFISGDALEIPAENNSFDFVFSTDMLEHIPREDRLKSLQEATRVCSDTCVIGFPCGELAKLHDDFWFHYLDASEKSGWKTGRHDRVPEHYEQGLPSEAEIDQLISQIEKEGHHVEKVWYNNILTWRDVIILEMKWLKRGYVGLCVLTMITRWYKIFGVPAHTEDQPGYRLFLVITKI